jgi:hypothetical protein
MFFRANLHSAQQGCDCDYNTSNILYTQPLFTYISLTYYMFLPQLCFFIDYYYYYLMVVYSKINIT